MGFQDDKNLIFSFFNLSRIDVDDNGIRPHKNGFQSESLLSDGMEIMFCCSINK